MSAREGLSVNPLYEPRTGISRGLRPYNMYVMCIYIYAYIYMHIYICVLLIFLNDLNLTLYNIYIYNLLVHLFRCSFIYLFTGT